MVLKVRNKQEILENINDLIEKKKKTLAPVIRKNKN
jgi:hypothetical protein